MRNNFIVSYDLIYPGQHYKAVHDAIKSTGRWYQFQFSLFYINTSYAAWEVDEIVARTMDANDKLLIADSRYAVVRGISQADIDDINRVWLATPANYLAGYAA